jgi:hypothetical protein
MAISEGMLKIGALVAGLGIPAALILLVRHSHRWRSQAVVVLGALTPLLVFFAVACIGAAVLSPPDSLGYYFVLRIVAFGFYVSILLLGICLSFLKRPISMWSRFALGMISAPLGCGLVLLLTRK